MLFFKWLLFFIFVCKKILKLVSIFYIYRCYRTLILGITSPRFLFREAQYITRQCSDKGVQGFLNMRDTEYKPPKITKRIRVPGLFFGSSNKELANRKSSSISDSFIFLLQNSTESKVKQKSEEETMGKIAEKGIGVAEETVPSQKESRCLKNQPTNLRKQRKQAK